MQPSCPAHGLQAMCSGVAPASSRASARAPSSSSKRTAGSLPFRAATASGVLQAGNSRSSCMRWRAQPSASLHAKPCFAQRLPGICGSPAGGCRLLQAGTCFHQPTDAFHPSIRSRSMQRRPAGAGRQGSCSPACHAVQGAHPGSSAGCAASDCCGGGGRAQLLRFPSAPVQRFQLASSPALPVFCVVRRLGKQQCMHHGCVPLAGCLVQWRTACTAEGWLECWA